MQAHKVLPRMGAEQTVTSAKLEGVTFTLRTISQRHQLWLYAKHAEPTYDAKGVLVLDAEGNPVPTHDETAVTWDLTRISLLDITGLEEEDGKPFTLEFDRVKILDRPERIVSSDCLERVPPDLLGEIIHAVRRGVSLEAKEREGLGFTSDSGSVSNAEIAPETNEPASTTAATAE